MALPAVRPLTMPVAVPMVATDGLALFHVPPVDVLPSVVVAPMQSSAAPVMGVSALTVTTTKEAQPVASV